MFLIHSKEMVHNSQPIVNQTTLVALYVFDSHTKKETVHESIPKIGLHRLHRMFFTHKKKALLESFILKTGLHRLHRMFFIHTHKKGS